MAPRPARATTATTATPPPSGNEVALPSLQYELMRPKWEIVRALWGGTIAMREAGERYLPREPKESVAAFENRLHRSTLFNGFRRTVKQLSGKPFKKAPKWSDKMPGDMEKWTENIDNNGRSLAAFAMDWLEDGLAAGLSYCLVDFPPQVRDTQGKVVELSLAEERELGRRPYFTMIRADDLIGWRSQKVQGKHVLTQIRIRENVVEDDGEFGTKLIERVRVIERNNWRLFQKSAIEANNWFQAGSGPNTLGEIGLVPFYANQNGFMSGEPTLMDLADLNLAHWQSSSDQRHILHIARVPILFGKNLAPRADPDGVIQGSVSQEIGPNRMILGQENSDLKYVEHGGAAIGAGRDDLADIEDRMTVMGLELLVRGPRMTATQKTIDTVESDSELHRIVANLKSATEQALIMAAKWVGEKPTAEQVAATYDTDFGITQREATEIDTLLKMRTAGEITRGTFYAELLRRGFLESSFDPEAEEEKLKAEAPDLTGEGLPLNGNQPPPRNAPPQRPAPRRTNGAGNESGADA